MRRILSLVALSIPLAATAGEGLNRNYTVVVRQSIQVGVVARPNPLVVCSEGGDDRTPHTVRSTTGQLIVIEDRWTSTGQDPVVCTAQEQTVLTLPAPKGQPKAEASIALPEDPSFHLTVSFTKD